MRSLNFAIRAAICTLFIFLPLQSMDQWFYDHFFRLRGQIKRPNDIVLVRVNDAKLFQLLNQEQIHFPKDEFAIEHSHHSIWHKHFYETILDKIEGDSPKAVVFTSFFEWVDNRAPTKFKYKNVIFSSTINDENKIVPPPGRLHNRDNYGFNNIFPDPDNIVRRSPLIYSSSNSLALKVQKELSSSVITQDLIEPIQIDFKGKEGTFQSYDAWELYDEPTTNGRYKDKIVLIGRDGSPASNVETPFGNMSRLEVHANTIDTFINKNGIRTLPRWTSLLVAGILVCVAVSVIFYFSLTVAWFILVLLASLLVLSTLFLFAELKLWYGIANPLFCIFGTHLLMIGYKLSRQEEEQWRIQQESQYLKEMDQFKNNFISLFSHDLKTPIAKIKAVTDRLINENKTLSRAVVEDLKTIDRTSNELARFISDILKVTKMESMSLEIARGAVDINQILEISVQRLKFLADEKNIRLIKDLEPLFSIEGDQDLLQEVVFNLVENAIKYSPADTQVILQSREIENHVVVSIIDQGIGIPADEIPRVTGKFYRGKTTADKTKGSGLGLYLSKYFVELHGGTLSIQSAPGTGTILSFKLPLQG